MKLKFCGAARVVTGSAHLLTLDNGYKILMDCGLLQGRNPGLEDFNESFHFDPKEVDLMILSHAHIDHSGRIPKLVRDGFTGNILCTHATRSLCSIMLLDSAKIQVRDAAYYNKKNPKAEKEEPLYETKDVKKAMNLFIGLSYDRWHYVTDGVRLLLRDAGHLLGSASVTLEIDRPGQDPVRVGFTGDIGRPMRPILRDPIQMPEVDYLICESTYGNRDHIAAKVETEKFIEIMKEVCVKRKGKLLIPAFSVGRTQEVVYMMDQLENEGLLPKIPVFVDSPLAVNATQIYGSHPECYDEELNEYLLIDSNPFGFRDLSYIRDRRSSKQLNDYRGGCVVISAAGMLNAGRSKHHLFNMIGNARNGVLMVGYCAPSTPGGRLQAGAEEITLFYKTLPVKASIHRLESISGHGDRGEMRDFISNQRKLKSMYLVHGEYESQVEFRAYLEKYGYSNIEIPSLGQEFTLP
ncbi:MAG: MBL fold metallo-hydrolase [Bacteroidota bacterium]